MQGEREPEYRCDGGAEMKHILYASYWGEAVLGRQCSPLLMSLIREYLSVQVSSI